MTRARFGALRPADLLALVWTLLFLSWVVTGWGGARWTGSADFVFFAVLGPAVGALQLIVASRLPIARERLAWRLLAAASIARSLSGIVWGAWLEASPNVALPWWLLPLQWSYLAFGIAALLVFPSAKLASDDRRRYRVDAAMVFIGSLLVVWFFALGPFFGSRALTTGYLDAFVHSVGDSVTVVLAAALHLRGATRLTRDIALPLLGAFVLQLIPDILLSGDSAWPISVVNGAWYAVWVLKWAAARHADAVTRSGDAEARTSEDPRDAAYRSGALPVLFIAAATALLFVELGVPGRPDRTLFAGGSAVLTALLVVRQAVELRARDRLQREIAAEEGRFRALLHHAYDAVVLFDGSGTVRYSSPATTRMLGERVIEAKEWALLETVHADDRESVLAAFRDAKRAPQMLSMRVRDHGGEWRSFDGYLQDRRDDPLIGGFVLNGLDRTREFELTQGLRDARQLEALGVLASGLAHDLNNILTVVASHAELLQEDDSMTAAARADLGALRAASDRAQALTRGLLTLSRRKGAVWAVVDVDGLMRERLLARSWDVGASGSGAIASRTVRADRGTLAQVIDAVLDEATSGVPKALGPMVGLSERSLDAPGALALRVEPGRYLVIGVGDAMPGPPSRVEDAVKTSDDGEWDLAPGDLAMLMALAGAREVGGTVTREWSGEAQRFAIYLPSVAA